MPGYLKFPPGMKDTLILAAGDTGTGADFHNHHTSWCWCLKGAKFWLVYPPEYEPEPAISEAVSSGCTHRLVETLQSHTVQGSKLACFVQKSEEIVYLPPDWHHAVHNLEPSTTAVVLVQCKPGAIAPVGMDAVYVVQSTPSDKKRDV